MSEHLAKQVKEHIHQYIEDNGLSAGAALTDESNFVDEGLLDSFAILTLILDLESEYAIKFDQAEIVGEEIRTIGGLAGIVAKHVSKAEAQ